MTTVRIIYHHEPDGWWAESPNVAGWSAAGEGNAEVVMLAEGGVPFALGGSEVVPASLSIAVVHRKRL